MAEDLIDRLKRKEDEFETLIAEARKSAVAIKDDTIKLVRELKAARRIAMEEVVRSESAIREAQTNLEVEAIEQEAQSQAGRIRNKGKERLEAAVNEVLIRVVGGIGDKGDAKNPDNRAKRVIG